MQDGLYVYTLWKNKSLAVSSRDAKNGETRASWRRQLNRFFAPLPSLEKEGRKEGGCPISPGVFKKLLALLFTVEVVALPPRYTTEILMLHTSYSVRIRRRREEKEGISCPDFLLWSPFLPSGDSALKESARRNLSFLLLPLLSSDVVEGKYRVANQFRRRSNSWVRKRKQTPVSVLGSLKRRRKKGKLGHETDQSRPRPASPNSFHLL